MRGTLTLPNDTYFKCEIMTDYPEHELEAIRSKWAKPYYKVGVQCSGNYIHQEDALKMIDILEKHQVPFDGFETFTLSPGVVQPIDRLSMDYWSGDGLKETPYAHAREHIKKLMADGDVFYFQISYDCERRVKEDIEAGRIKRPDNWDKIK